MAEEDIIELEKRYWQLQANSSSGKMDVATLGPLISPPLPESIVQGFFDAFDETATVILTSRKWLAAFQLLQEDLSLSDRNV